MLVLFGLAAGVPGGALLALTSQATTPANRGTGLGVFYTCYYAGMTVAPAVAGWLRDTLQQAGAPVLFAGALMVATVFTVLLLRLLQARNGAGGGAPIQATDLPRSCSVHEA